MTYKFWLGICIFILLLSVFALAFIAGTLIGAVYTGVWLFG